MILMQHLATIAFLFFCSGFAALSFEIVWCRLFLRVLGAGSIALSCVFAAFMAGAAAGAFLAARHSRLILKLGSIGGNISSENDSRAYLRAYGRLELLLACSGLALSLLLADPSFSRFFSLNLAQFSADDLSINMLRFSISFLLLLVPCMLMGAVYPVLCRGFLMSRERKDVFALLYGLNTLGAASGSAVAAFHLIPGLGISGTALVAALIDILIFLALEFLTSRAQPSFSPSAESSGALGSLSVEKAQADGGIRIIAASVFLSGVVALIFQMVWARIFSLVLGSSLYSSGTVLLMVLLSVGASSLLVQRLQLSRGVAIKALALLFYFFGICLLLSAYFSKLLFWLFVESSFYLTPLFASDLFMAALAARMILALVFIFVPSFLIGSILPLAVSAAGSNKRDIGGSFYAINCLGASLACLIYNFLLFPSLEASTGRALLSTLLFLTFLSFSGGAILLFSDFIGLNGRKSSFSLVALLILSFVPLAFLNRSPVWDSGMMSSGYLLYQSANMPKPDESAVPPLFYDESINSTVSVVSNSGSNSISLRSDGKVEATLPLDRSLIAPTADLNTHILLSALPLLFHDGVAENAFIIGLGSGVSASTLLGFPELKKLDLAEIEKAVLDACRLLAPYNGDPLSEGKGRLRIKTQDARFALQATKTKYDLIVSQPADPWVSGSSDLYTTEFFKIASACLNESGVYCQWVQLYAIPDKTLLSLMDSFCSVFPRAYICRAPGAGELILLGYKNEKHDLIANSPEAIKQSAPRIMSFTKGSDSLAFCGIENAEDALSFVLAGPDQLRALLRGRKLDRHTDDSPLAEYETCRNMLKADSKLQDNLKSLAASLKRSSLFLPLSNHSRERADASKKELVSMSRSYARQALLDASPLRALNQQRALASLEQIGEKDSAYYIWSKKLVMETLFQKEYVLEASSLKPNDDCDSLALFDMYFSSGKPGKASEFVDAAEACEASSNESGLRRSFCIYAQGRAAESAQGFKKLLSENPCQQAALLGAAYAADACADLKLAEQYLRRYLFINPWDFETQLLFTDIACRQNKLDDALKHADCACSLRPEDCSAFFLVLERALENHNRGIAALSLKRLLVQKQDRRVDKLASAVGGGAEKLRENRDFLEIVKKIRSHVQESKKGYKIFGQL